MRNLLYSLLILTSTFLIISCNGSKKTTETNQKTEPAKEEIQPVSEETYSEPKSKVESDRGRVESKEEWLGIEIVEEAANRLTSRLSTDQNQTAQIRSIIEGTFRASGGDLTQSYSRDTAREMGRTIIKRSAESIMGILNENQQAVFKKLIAN